MVINILHIFTFYTLVYEEILKVQLLGVHNFVIHHTIDNVLKLSLLNASFLREKMNHFSLKMHQIYHMSFCMTILTRKFC